jgi:hypothetical protein
MQPDSVFGCMLFFELTEIIKSEIYIDSSCHELVKNSLAAK